MANQVLYGFHNLKDLMTQRVSTIDTTVINTAIQDTLTEHNRQMDALLSLFVKRTTMGSARFVSPAVRRLQPLDEAGRARPTKRAGYYDVGFPLLMAGDAWGADYVTRQKMTVQEVNDNLAASLSADFRWMRDHILAALFDNVGWTFGDPLLGNLAVKGLANADSVQYLLQSGGDSGATSQHYLAQAAAIADATNPYPTIYSLLLSHPENSGNVIALIPTALKATTEALAVFAEADSDPDITLGSGSSRLTGTLSESVPGTVIGKANNVWIVEWPSLPATHIIAVATDGEPPLAMREDEEAQLRGYRAVAERNDYPWWEAQYMRRAGFGAWNRVGAVVQRVGNAAYAIPTGYTSPMA